MSQYEPVPACAYFSITQLQKAAICIVFLKELSWGMIEVCLWSS